VELATLEIESRSRADGDDLIEGVLRCTGCARRFAVVDGIPVLLRDAGEAHLLGLLSQPLDPEVAAVLAGTGPDEAPLPHALAQLGSYLDSQWGDRADPAPGGPSPSFGFAALARKLRALSSVRVPLCLELGCGVGRGLSALARGAELVVGVDKSPWALRLARRILRDEEVRYPRRAAGRSYLPAAVRARQDAAPGAQLLCADAVDPPFPPGLFQRTVALNLLDSVRSPRELLHHLDQLTAPGGEIALASPYAWRSGITDDPERLGGADPAAALRTEVAQLGWIVVEDDDQVPWTLRRDARSASLYAVHWLHARKP
jgi:SAM-dependent methyltransferase